MPRVGPRGALVGLLSAAVLLGVGTWLARKATLDAVEGVMAARGLTWARRSDTVATATWTALSGPGVTARSVAILLLPRPQAVVTGVDVDLEAALDARPAGGGGGGGDAIGFEVPVVAEGVRVTWGDAVLVEDLRGTLAPTLDLRGAGGSLRRTDEGWAGELRRNIDVKGISGEAALELTCRPAGCEGRLRVADPVLDHPRVAPKPVELGALSLEGTWSPADGALSATGRVGPADVAVRGTLTPEPLAVDLKVTVADVLLEDVVGLFGRQIPEAARARVVGTVGLDAVVSGPPLRWALTPRAEGLGAADVLSDPVGLRHGAVTWKAAGADPDAWTIERRGPGLPHWTSLADAGRVPEAFMAAEDAGFWTHPGYDLRAMREALDRHAAEPDGPLRGGSTLTQQLAKNLFLDGGDRTLARKLRELLYALEMERALGKERILELYINIVELGPALQGVGEAADAYFLKPPAYLTPREAAFLAAILPAPRTRGERAWLGGATPDARIDAILDNMVDGKALSPAQAAKAKRAPLRIVPPPR